MTLSNVNNRPLRVFDDSVLEFLGELSNDLLKSPVGRLYPDISAFAFYIRKANLLNLKASFGTTDGFLGRGMCFHIAPANIPINFAFSWVFSILAGNANIVRLPSKDFPQVAALLSAIKATIAKYPEIESRNVFVKYPRTDNETTAGYSAVAECRMIWGGDKTIAGIKSLPTMPRCIDVAFADRYSVGIIDGKAIESADDATMKRLAQNFYNDTYLMDQNACSSPQVILWENDSEESREKFWGAVYEFAGSKYQLQDAISVDKYTTFCEEAIGNENTSSMTKRGNLLYRVELKALSPDMISHRGKAGFFFEYSLKDRADLFAVVTEKFQTIVQFGIDSAALREQIIAANLRGIDRIVPIGKAMDIGAIWDGVDLVHTLSRYCSIS